MRGELPQADRGRALGPGRAGRAAQGARAAASRAGRSSDPDRGGPPRGGARRRRSGSGRTSARCAVRRSARVRCSTPASRSGPGATVGADACCLPRGVRGPGLHGRRARVVLQAGAVIGGDGFGWAFLDGKLQQDSAGRDGRARRRRRDRRQLVHRPGADRRHPDRRRNQDRQPGADRTQLPDRQALRDRGLRRHGRHDDRSATTCRSAARPASGAHHGRQRGPSSRAVAEVWGDVAEGEVVSGRPAQNHRDELRLQAYDSTPSETLVRVQGRRSREATSRRTIEACSTKRRCATCRSN